MKLRRFITVLLILILLVLSARYVLMNVRYRLEYRGLIQKYAEEYKVDPYLVMSVINAESRFDEDAVSPKGAVGLMQITEPTAEWIAKSMGDKDFVIDDLYDPETNIRMGIWYIDNLRKEFGITELVLAAYNAGRGHVNEWLDTDIISREAVDVSRIPFGETENYVKKVMADVRIYKLLYEH
jgi:soluble lytic murein transglycosylase